MSFAAPGFPISEPEPVTVRAKFPAVTLEPAATVEIVPPDSSVKLFVPMLTLPRLIASASVRKTFPVPAVIISVPISRFRASAIEFPILPALSIVTVAAAISTVVSSLAASVMAPVALIVRSLVVESASFTAAKPSVVVKMDNAAFFVRVAPLFAIVVAPRCVVSPSWTVPEALSSALRSVVSRARVPAPVSLSAPALAPNFRAVPFSAARRSKIPVALTESSPAELSVILSAVRVTFPVPVMDVSALVVSNWSATRVNVMFAPEISSFCEVVTLAAAVITTSPVAAEIAPNWRFPAVWLR